jgi:hypothetical protein
MTHDERIRHEFFLLQGKLGADDQFFHFDRCPVTLDGDFQLTFDAVYWADINLADIFGKEAWYTPKESMRRIMILLCDDTKKKIDSIIEILEKEKPDAEAKNIGTEESG